MSLTVRPEPLTRESAAEALSLARENYAETGAWSPEAFDPDLDTYAAVAAAGSAVWHVARDAHGRLVGYALMLVAPHPHYGGQVQATQDALYLTPAARRGTSGIRLIQASDALLADAGVPVVYRQATAGRDVGAVLERLGYRPLQTTYGRRLDRGR